jgi:hypothetical protein
MEAGCSSEMLVYNKKTALCNSCEDHNVSLFLFEYLRSYAAPVMPAQHDTEASDTFTLFLCFVQPAAKAVSVTEST